MVTFNFSYAPGTTLEQMTGFEMAGRVWSAYLRDPIAVNIYVGVSSSLPAGSIGGALPGIQANQTYIDVVRGLGNDITSWEDHISVPNLRNKSDYEAWFDAFDPKNGKNNGQKAKTKFINITRANAKAIDINLGSASDLDGVILFGTLGGTNFSWNYDYTRSAATPPANTLDFLSTAMHEIGHILGFVSGVDKPGWLSSVTADKAASDEYKKSLAERATFTTPLDLFRYSNVAGMNINDLSYGTVGGSTKFFSINGGGFSLAEFSTGSNQILSGDGFQASHWKNTATRTGLMAPAIKPQERSWMSTTDLRAFDVIGWDINYGANVSLSTLRTQSQQALAQRIGVTTTWLTQNAQTAADQIDVDRFADVDRMIRDSEIYPWTPKPPGNTPPPPPPNPWKQVLDLFQQQVVYGSFATLDEFGTAPQAEVKASDLKAPKHEAFKRVELDFSMIASKAIEISQMVPLESSDLQKWFERLETSKQSVQMNARKSAELWKIVKWADL